MISDVGISISDLIKINAIFNDSGNGVFCLGLWYSPRRNEEIKRINSSGGIGRSVYFYYGLYSFL